MGRLILKKITTNKKVLLKNLNAKLVKDKKGKYHCSKCGAFISK